ncbi:MAG TPA: WD40 repeat domain-containing protein, partial [Thermoanaerobaculia bacterium]
ENVRQQQRLAQARRLASDLQARRSARVYSPPEDVLQAIEVSNILGDFGLDLEAHAVLAGAIEALPRRVSSFRAAAPIRASAMAGDRLLTVSDGSRRVEMWDLRSGRLVKPLPHAGTVSDLAVSRDGAFAVTRTRERVAHLWELATAAERGTYRCSDGKGTSRGLVAVSREGRYIALLCGNGDAVQLFERGRDSALATVQEEHGTIREMQFSKDLRHLAVIWSEDFDSAALYDIGQQMAPLPMERECFAGNQKIRFGAEAGMVVSSRVDGEDSTVFGNNSVRICRLQKSGSPVRLPHSFPTNEEFTSDGKYLATGEPSTVRIWTTGRGEQTTAIRGPAAQPALSFSPDDRYLAIRWSGELWIVESPSGRMAAAIPVSRDWSLLGWSAEGHMAVLAHRPSGRIEVWEIQPIQKAKGIVLAGRPIETGFSSSGQELLTVDRYETPEGLEYSAVQVWSMETGKALFKEEKMGDPVSGGGLSVDGTKVAVFTPHYGEEVDGSLVEVFDVGSRRLGERIEAQVRLRAVAHRPLRGWIGLEAGSHRTRVVAIAAGGTKVLWQGPEDARFVSGGRFVAAVGESGRGRIFDVDRGREIRVSPRLKLYSAMDLLLTNGGRLLAAIPEGDLTRIADLETGATQSTLPVPAQVVRWSPGGKFLLTAADGVARVWELPGGVERAQTNYMGEIGTAAFSSDTLRVALGVNRGVSVWAWRTDEVRKRTCAILGVNRQSPGWSTSLPVAEYRRICGRS